MYPRRKRHRDPCRHALPCFGFSGFGILVSVFGFRFLTLRLHDSGFGIRVSGFRLGVPILRLRFSGFGFRVSRSGFKIQFLVSAFGIRFQASGRPASARPVAFQVGGFLRFGGVALFVTCRGGMTFVQDFQNQDVYWNDKNSDVTRWECHLHGSLQSLWSHQFGELWHCSAPKLRDVYRKPKHVTSRIVGQPE